MNKKDSLVKANYIRSQLVIFCQRITKEEIADMVERMIPDMDKVIDEINKCNDKELR